jgi:hypothetical protein
LCQLEQLDQLEAVTSMLLASLHSQRGYTPRTNYALYFDAQAA